MENRSQGWEIMWELYQMAFNGATNVTNNLFNEAGECILLVKLS